MYNSLSISKEGIITAGWALTAHTEERVGSGESRSEPCATNKHFQGICSLKSAFSLRLHVELEEEWKEKRALLFLQFIHVSLSVLDRPLENEQQWEPLMNPIELQSVGEKR